MKFLSICFVLLATASVSSAKLIDGTVGYVNNEAILESDLSDLKVKSEKQASIFDMLLGEYSVGQLKTDRKAQIEYLINEKLLDSEIKRLGLTVTQEAAEAELSGIASQQGMTKTEFLERIKAQGMNISEYQAILKNLVSEMTEVSSYPNATEHDKYTAR